MPDAVNTLEQGKEDKIEPKEETESKDSTENKQSPVTKQRSVSFNRDVHVKRIGKMIKEVGVIWESVGLMDTHFPRKGTHTKIIFSPYLNYY